MKIPIFDGSDRTKYQEWEDDILAVLEYHDLEEYVGDVWKNKKIPEKTDTDATKTLQRREMKKAKAILVRGTKDLPNMYVKDASTPFEAFAALQEKYKVKKVREDFDKLDSDWNDFKVSDLSIDPDLVFKTLEEQSKKLAIFGERYSKDALQTLSKLKTSLPKEYDHVFTFLNTNEERNKSFEDQLETAKTMISSHYKTKIIGEGKVENSMIFTVRGGATAPTNPYSDHKCEFCHKKGHPMKKNGKPFCFKYKKKLKQERRDDNEGSSASNKNDKDINSLFINCVEIDKKPKHAKNLWLGDTGAQCHVRMANESDTGKSIHTVKMGNNSTASVLSQENITIKDDLGTALELNQVRVVKGMTTNVISLMQLMDEGWTVKPIIKNKKKIIQVTKKDKRLIFEEGDKKNLCFLSATTEKSMLITSITEDQWEDSMIPSLTPVENSTISNTAKITQESKPVKITTTKNALKKWNYNEFHDKMGHHGEEMLCFWAKQLGYQLVGERNACDACNLVKTKARAIPKVTKNPSTHVGERVGLDISGPFPLTSGVFSRSIQHKLFWYGMTDHYSSKMISAFGHTKKDLVDFVDQTYEFMKTRGTPIKCIRMDNAGENKIIQQRCKTDWNVNTELTPPDTPKLNGVQERAFAIRWEKAKILLQAAGLKDNVKKNKKILIRAINTASFLIDECPHKRSKECNNDLFYGSSRKPKVRPEHFVQWGRVGFVPNKRTHTTKMKARGTAMMFVGYALNHPSGTYEFYNPTTDGIVISNSVRWKDFNRWEATRIDSAVGKLYAPTTPQDNDAPSSDEDDFDEPVTPNVTPVPLEDTVTLTQRRVHFSEPPAQPTGRITRSQSRGAVLPPHRDRIQSSKVQRALKKISTSPTYKVTGNTVPTSIFDADTDTVINTIMTDDVFITYTSVGGMDTIDDEDCILENFILHTCIQSDPGEPTKWKEAFNGPEREWWIQSATAEFNNFISRKAWKFVPRKDVTSKGRKIVPTKLVFKKKDEIDGSIRFKTRDVTLGFMMIPGVDYTERFSPVATDAALRVQIAINLKNYHIGWRTRSCDIEAAFLESDMDVEMFIEPHPAMVECGFLTEEQRLDTAIQLMKSMYGNVDAAIKFFKTLSSHLTKKDGMNMSQSKSDPCVFFKKNSKNELILIVSITVDDCAITGLNDDIEWFMTGLETRFKITRDNVISKHLGVNYEWGVNENGLAFCRATMDKKVKSTIDYYEKHTGKPVKEASTPGIPNEVLKKHEGTPIDIDQYRSLVGRIMFFSTKVCPKIGAATRALSTHMSNPGPSHWKAMDRLVGYLKHMELKGVYYLEPHNFKTISLADTDYGNCKETRRSVGCSLITVGGCLVDWWMAKHHTVSDSSCEAEYKELAKCAKGVKFIQMMLGEFNLVDLPGYIGEDNKGAIFLAYNKQVSERTKHIDIKFHFIREFVENHDGVQQGEIFKIDTKDNTADIGTKNIEVGLFNKHEFELDNGMLELREKIFFGIEN